MAGWGWGEMRGMEAGVGGGSGGGGVSLGTT